VLPPHILTPAALGGGYKTGGKAAFLSIGMKICCVNVSYCLFCLLLYGLIADNGMAIIYNENKNFERRMLDEN